MTDRAMLPILLTGASGALGRVLARTLADAGWTLRLTDIAPFSDPVPVRAAFTQADLGDAGTMARLAEGTGTILHFGGVSVERPFHEVLGPNIIGLYNIYEAARLAQARVVFASSNHTIGFHPRSERLDVGCAFRPDGYYGLSKAYGELMGSLYWDKHGVESVQVRIGSCLPAPKDARMLSTYLSYDDLSRLVVRCALAGEIGTAVVWGASANARSFWGVDDRARLGWSPQDSADGFAPALDGVVTDDPVVERHQGGAYCRIEYTNRSLPVPGARHRPGRT